MKKILFLFLFAISLTACGQQDAQTFDKPATFKAGFRFSVDGPIYTSMPVSTVDWNTLAGKPVFSPVAISGDYNDLKNKPEPVQPIGLAEAINKLGYLPIPSKTTVEINNMFLPAGYMGIVFDKDLNVYKLWDKTQWNKIIITNQ